MAESQGDFILLQTMKPVEMGEVYRKIPPHVTILSWFTINRALLKDFYPVLDRLVAQYGEQARQGVGVKRVLFGVNEDIPACTIQLDVQELHDEAMNWVDTYGGAFKYEKYARELSTHVTDEPGISLQPNEPIEFSSVALFSILPKDGANYKRVEYAAPLGGNHETTS